MAQAQAGKYYVPHDSRWPFIGSAAFFTLLLGVIALLNHWTPAWAMIPGFALVVYMFIGWFGDVIKENNTGLYGLDVDRSFRMGMMWFIFSEVMFFAAFFGALFYARALSVPWLGGEGTKSIGNLLLHLSGNVRQWIVSGVGGQPDVRKRNMEFAARGGATAAGMLDGLDATLRECDEVLRALLPSELKIFTPSPPSHGTERMRA
jgi:hypothetical protein